MVTPMSPDQEEAIFNATSRAIRLSNDGLEPSNAIAKVASDKGFSQEFTKRMVEAYNVSKTLNHIKSAAGDERVASFPLADADEVFGLMFPNSVAAPNEEKKSSWVPVESKRKETRFFDLEHEDLYKVNKRAEETHTWDQQDLDLLLNRAYGEVERAEIQEKEAAYTKTKSLEDLHGAITKFAEYFRTTNKHEPFENVESVALGLFGESIKSAMNIAWQHAHLGGLGEKRASASGKIDLVDETPYKYLQDIMNYKIQAAEAVHDWEKKAEYAHNYRELINKYSQQIKKQAVSGGAQGAAADSLLAGLIDSGPSTQELLMTAIAGMGDPGVELERKSIRARMLLKNLMEQDEVLSQVEPTAVIDAYNQIASLAPSAVESPIVLQSLLRTVIEQGQLTPQELTTVTKLEKEIGQQSRELPSELEGALPQGNKNIKIPGEELTGKAIGTTVPAIKHVAKGMPKFKSKSDETETKEKNKNE